MLSIYIQGLSLGLAYVAPIGMQNLFVIHNAMSQRFGRTMATAFIIAFWDIFLGLACFLGAGAVMEFFPWLQNIILGLGGLLVIYIGVGLIRAKADLQGGKDVHQPLWKIITTSFIVTWLNPQALIDGTLMLGAFRASLPIGSDSYFITGFASASLIWFISLTIMVHLLGSKMNGRVLTWINRLCGTVIALYGIKLIYSLGQLL